MVAKFKAKNQREKEIQGEVDAQNKVVQKQKSANERELERYGKEAREKMIERRVKFERGKRQREIWKTTITKNNARGYIDNSLMRERASFLTGGMGRW